MFTMLLLLFCHSSYNWMIAYDLLSTQAIYIYIYIASPSRKPDYNALQSLIDLENDCRYHNHFSFNYF